MKSAVNCVFGQNFLRAIGLKHDSCEVNTNYPIQCTGKLIKTFKNLTILQVQHGSLCASRTLFLKSAIKKAIILFYPIIIRYRSNSECPSPRSCRHRNNEALPHCKDVDFSANSLDCELFLFQINKFWSPDLCVLCSGRGTKRCDWKILQGL